MNFGKSAGRMIRLLFLLQLQLQLQWGWGGGRMVIAVEAENVISIG